MAEAPRLDWRVFAIMFALVGAAFVARAVYAFNGGTPLLADTDDAMRMVVVRDFLDGQGWFDNVQHRLNTPFGAELHWSRLADLPLAGLILVLRPLLGGFAETAAAVVLPLMLLSVLLYLCGRIALKLVGPEGLLPALALPAFSLSVLGEFAPGRIDHHSLQIILMMAMIWCSIEALTRPRFAIGAGLAAATAIAIGIEGLPGVGAAILAFGLMWVSTPARADALRWFGLSFAAGAAIHLAIALPPERWLVPMCDAISVVYVAAAVGVGVAFLILSLLPVGGRSIWVRLALGAGTGAVVAIALAIAFPDCLRGPYAGLDPWLVTNWIDRITEAAPLWQSLVNDPIYPLAVLVPPLVGLLTVLWRVTRGERTGRGEWLIYLSFLAIAIATMLLQIRASRLTTVAAVPACAALIVMARHFYLERRNVLRVVPLLMSWLVSAGLAVALAVSAIVGFFPAYAESLDDPGLGEKRACLAPAAFTELAGMPPERIMTPIDLGAHMLVHTPREVVAAPYHRNAQGVRDTFDFFNGPIDTGRTILEARGVSLIVICPAMPEMRGLPDAAADSFVRLYSVGALPAWLVEYSLPDAPLKVFAVMPR